MDQCRTCSKVGDSKFWHLLYPSSDIAIVQFREQLILWEIDIHQGDQLPNKICNKCYTNAIFVRKIRDQCLERNRVLYQLRTYAENSINRTNATLKESNIDKIANENFDNEAEGRKTELNDVEIFSAFSGDPEDLIMDLSEIEEEIRNENCLVEDITGIYDEYANEDESQKLSDDGVEPWPIEDLSIKQAIENIMLKIKNELARHIKVPPNPLLCHLCISNKSFHLLYKNEEALEWHQRSDHTDPFNLIKCVLCERYFNTRERCLKHFIEHDKLGEVCPICGKYYGHLILHLNNTHNTHDFTCEICGLVLRNTSKHRFKHHQKWHNPDKQLKCPYNGCTRTFLQKPHLKVHIATHTGVTDYRCNTCEKDFCTPLTLKEHLIRKHGVQSDIKCKICYKVFVSTKERHQHVRKVHPEEYSEICDICKQTFQSVTTLRKHIRIVHELSTKKEPQPILGRHRKGRAMHGFYRCEMCQQQFHSESTLKVHNQKHSPEGRPFSCPDCPNFYKSPKSLRAHQQFCHTPLADMAHVCNFCEKRFAFRYELNAHVLQHNTKKFGCNQCKGSFASERYLKRHQATKHAVIHKYDCDYCDLKFLDRPKAIAHMKKQHDELYFKNIY